MSSSKITSSASNIYTDLDKLNIPTFLTYLLKIIKNSFFSVFQFFTPWVIVLSALFYAGNFQYYQNSLLLVSVIVSLYGLMIIYYYPRRLVVPYFDLNVSNDQDKNKFGALFDIIFHQVPLILILLKYNRKISGDNLLLGLIFSALYIIINNPNKVYQFKCENCENNGKTDIERCFVSCFILNLSVILLTLSILVILALELQKTYKN